MLTDERLRHLWDAHLTMSHEDRLEDHLPLIRAVEAEAYEAAAKVCESPLVRYSGDGCAAAIRALAGGKP